MVLPGRQVPLRNRMAIRNNTISLRIAVSIGVLISMVGGMCTGTRAQTQAPAAASVSQLGTVKAVSGNTVTLTTDAGQTVTITVPSGAQVVQLAVGSTDLKTGKPGQFADIALGDRVLATGKAGQSATNFNALRVVLIKSTAIAQMQAAQQADWKARGTGGIVSSVDTVKGTIALESGSKKLTILTSSATKFRRFEDGSVKYEDSKPGTLAQVRPKDQLQVLGNKSADGLTIQAEEVMSGSFLNLSGLVTSIVPGSGIDPATGTITFKDLATKKIMTVNVTFELRYAQHTVGDSDDAGEPQQRWRWRRRTRGARRAWRWRGEWGGKRRRSCHYSSTRRNSGINWRRLDVRNGWGEWCSNRRRGARGHGRRHATLGWSGPLIDDASTSCDQVDRPEDRRRGDGSCVRAISRSEHRGRNHTSFRG